MRVSGASVLVLGALLAFAPGALAAVRYASPLGSDGAGAEPCNPTPCGLVRAVNSANTGDEVIAESGTYGPSVAISTPLAVDGSPASLHGIAGQERPLIRTSANTGLSVEGNGQLARHLELEHTGSTGLRPSALQVLPGATADQILAHTSAGQNACSLGGTLLSSVCWNTNSGTSGAAVFGTDFGSNTTATLRNVTAVATSLNASGVRAHSDFDDLTINATNVVAIGGDVDAYAENSSDGNATLALTYSNFGSSKADGTHGSVTAPDTPTNQSAPPVFADFVTGDFHEAAGSPTIDAGVDSSANGSFDLDGETRKMGTRTDIGADERFAPAVGGGGAAAVGGGSGAPARLAVTGLSASRSVFRVDTRGEVARRRRRVARGTRFRFNLNAAAQVRFAIERRTRGRRVRGRCRRKTRRNRRRRPCTRYVVVRRFTRQGVAGANQVPFSGRVRIRGRARALRPGRYRATLRALGQGRSSSPPARVRFRIVK